MNMNVKGNTRNSTEMLEERNCKSTARECDSVKTAQQELPVEGVCGMATSAPREGLRPLSPTALAALREFKQKLLNRVQ